MLEGKKGVHTWMILMTTTMMSLKKGTRRGFQRDPRWQNGTN
jgi:hypothetical protein